MSFCRKVLQVLFTRPGDPVPMIFVFLSAVMGWIRTFFPYVLALIRHPFPQNFSFSSLLEGD